MKLYQSKSGICLTVLVAALAACGGGSGGGSTTASIGVLVDSAVSGIGYKTATQSGITNAKGEFFFCLAKR